MAIFNCYVSLPEGKWTQLTSKNMAVFCKSYQPLYDVYAPWVSLVNFICFRKDAPSHVVLPQSLPRSPEKQADQVEEHQARCGDVWSVSFERNFNLEQAKVL